MILPRKTEAMPGFCFINSQGEPQVFGRQEGGSGFEHLVCFMLRQENSFAQKFFQPVAFFQQLDGEFFKCNRILCPIMVGYLVTSDRNRKCKMFASRSWVSGHSFWVPCMNIAIAAPTL
jgi:hypothetical protein